MMSKQLEGADLALAVAKVMGLSKAYLCEDKALGWVSALPTVYFYRDEDWHTWRPDLGGAAGAEVLDWLCQHHRVSIGLRDGEFACHRWPIRGGNLEMTTGPTKWIALCRAIVAYGKDNA